jgi:hypothetical protein
MSELAPVQFGIMNVRGAWRNESRNELRGGEWDFWRTICPPHHPFTVDDIKFPKDDIGDDDNDGLCKICYCEYSEPIITECRHKYCKSCILSWLNKHQHDSCPLCRYIFCRNDSTSHNSIVQMPSSHRRIQSFRRVLQDIANNIIPSRHNDVIYVDETVELPDEFMSPINILATPPHSGDFDGDEMSSIIIPSHQTSHIAQAIRNIHCPIQNSPTVETPVAGAPPIRHIRFPIPGGLTRLWVARFASILSGDGNNGNNGNGTDEIQSITDSNGQRDFYSRPAIQCITDDTDDVDDKE